MKSNLQNWHPECNLNYSRKQADPVRGSQDLEPDHPSLILVLLYMGTWTDCMVCVGWGINLGTKEVVKMSLV